MAINSRSFVDAVIFVNLTDRLYQSKMKFCRAEYYEKFRLHKTKDSFTDYVLNNYGIKIVPEGYQLIDERKFLLFQLKFGDR